MKASRKEYFDWLSRSSIKMKIRHLWLTLCIPAGLLHELWHIFFSLIFRQLDYISYAAFEVEDLDGSRYSTNFRVTYHYSYFDTLSQNSMGLIAAISPIINYLVLLFFFKLWAIPVLLLFHNGFFLSASDFENIKNHLTRIERIVNAAQ